MRAATAGGSKPRQRMPSGRVSPSRSVAWSRPGQSAGGIASSSEVLLWLKRRAFRMGERRIGLRSQCAHSYFAQLLFRSGEVRISEFHEGQVQEAAERPYLPGPDVVAAETDGFGTLQKGFGDRKWRPAGVGIAISTVQEDHAASFAFERNSQSEFV